MTAAKQWASLLVALALSYLPLVPALQNGIILGTPTVLHYNGQQCKQWVKGVTSVTRSQRSRVVSRNIAVTNGCQASMSLLRTFQPKELLLQRFIGELGFMEITDWEYYGRETTPLDPSTPSRTINNSGTTVRLFEARTPSDERVVLKEFFPDATSLAQNEMEIFEFLLEAWEVSIGTARELPIMTLMGSLVTDETFKTKSFVERWVSKFPTLPLPGVGNTWLVYRWEGQFTFASYPFAKQEAEFLDGWRPDAKENRRAEFVREMMRQAVVAVLFIHEAGVAHRSLGAPSFRMNTMDERNPGQLEVFLSDFGFACPVAEIDDETFRRAEKFGCTKAEEVSDFLLREDLYSLGYVFLELVFKSFCAIRSRAPDQSVLKRNIEDISKGDFKDFKDYCLGEDSWVPAVNILDRNRNAGWELAAALLNARGGKKSGRMGIVASTSAILSFPYFNTED
ncbi:unnamed protein product [Choristocarpus tenellus]